MLKKNIMAYLTEKGKIVNSEEIENYLHSKFPHDYISYQEFASVLTSLVAEGSALTPVGGNKSNYLNNRQPPLHKKYRNLISIQRRSSSKKEVGEVGFHRSINLTYYEKKPSFFEKDEAIIQIISSFIERSQESKEEIWEINERSLDLFGNEKWLKENNSILKRIGLTERDLHCKHSPEPFAYRKAKLVQKKEELKVLIIENKDTYKSLERLFKEGICRFGNTTFNLLVYGGGKRILASLPYLYEIEEYSGQKVVCEYFGDIDAEGISIWYNTMWLNPEFTIRPCHFLYSNLLEKAGDKTRRLEDSEQREVEGLHVFSATFKIDTAKNIEEIVNSKQILPQEGLNYSLLRELGDFHE